MSVIIIESPNKQDKIQKITGFKTFATIGHFKVLPKKNYINYETYEPVFDYPNEETKKRMNYIISQCKDEEVFIATDPDREGYGIGFMFYLAIKNIAKSIKRAEFHEITETGIQKGLEKAIDFTKSNFNEYEAFKARAVGDRLVGYILSPKYIQIMNDKNVSVGRVQTPALSLITQREKEIIEFSKLKDEEKIDYKVKALIEREGKELEIIREELYKNKQEAQDFINYLKQNNPENKVILSKIEQKESKKAPPMPFRTSQLQEKANAVYGFSSEQTMSYAQLLFEYGLITYTRTDSNALSKEFIDEVEKHFSQEEWYQKREYKAGKQSQAEAHEAIRITHCHQFDEIDKVIEKANKEAGEKKKLTDFHKQLYTLIFINSILSQAKDSISLNYTYIFMMKTIQFTAKASVLKYKGYKDVFSKNEDEDEENEPKAPLDFKENDSFNIKDYLLSEVKKQAPSRYKESNFISLLEKEGIGRPSTYASFLPKLKERNYVEIEKKGKNSFIKPTAKGLKIVEELLSKDEWITQALYTKTMEDVLDEISNNKAKYIDFIKAIHQKMDFAKENENRAPSAKQIEFLEKLAKAQNKEIPQECYEDLNAATKLIEELKKNQAPLAPSEKQIKLAKDLAEKNKLELPKDYDKNMKICSDFINKVFKKDKK